MTERTDDKIWQEVPSPFCGIAADDLTIQVTGQTVTVLENGDAITRSGFETPITDTAPRVDGKEVDLATAVARAAELVEASQQTVIGGLGTDLNGARAAMSLADKCRATVDHMNSVGSFKNTLVLQDTGWMATTLSEVRNRADLIVVVGTDIESSFPRFFERMVWPEQTLFEQNTLDRHIVYLGQPPSGEASTSPEGQSPQVIPCDYADFPEVMSVLRALVNGRMVQASQVGGIDIDVLRGLAEQLKSAKYGVMTWSASQWQFEQADITIQTLCEMIKELNDTTRCSGLSLAGKEGDVTVNNVAAWQSGYPMRTSFNQGFPDYDPFLYDSNTMLANGEVDTLVWVSSFDIHRTPPKSDANTIVLGRSGMVCESEPAVFIPVGTPGIDHVGRIFRTDSVVSLPLKKLRDSGLPSTFDVLSAIEQAIKEV